MRVALIGATGKVGHRLMAELASRGHDIIGVARSGGEVGGVQVRAVDANDPVALAEAVRGSAAVILAGRFVSTDASAILHALKLAGVPRLLVVGGAGTLEASPGTTLIEAGVIPDAFLPEVEAGRDFLDTLKASAADWTFLSPGAIFIPGERTGLYRLGDDALMRDQNGESRISYEDLAKALVDELESPAHSRRRFSIAY